MRRPNASRLCLALSLVLSSASVTRAEFRFKHHFIDRDLPGDSYGQTSLVDVDRDGDLDFVTGGKDAQKHVFWFEYRSPDEWVRHVLGENHPSDVGGRAIDVDGDGWVDHVSGGVWYRNTGKPRDEPFERHRLRPGAVRRPRPGRRRRRRRRPARRRHHVRPQQPPVVPQSRRRPDASPGSATTSAPASTRASPLGDIDGDGDNDVARSNALVRKPGRQGHAAWAAAPAPLRATRTRRSRSRRAAWSIDIDRDGHNDLVMTENEIRGGKIAWLRTPTARG